MNPGKPWKILAIGAGAIGTYVGGSLALAGSQVIFLERPNQAEYLRSNGLHLKLPHGEFHIPTPSLVISVEEAMAGAPFDLALFAVKSYHTRSAIEPFLPFVAQMPPVLCLQNGVDNEPLLVEMLGPGKVIAGTLTSAIGRPSAHTIQVERLRGIGIASEHLLAASLVPILNNAGLNARLFPRSLDMKWSKLLTNLVANPLSAILDFSPAQIFAYPALARIEADQLLECLAVMRRLGARVVDLPGTPVRLMSFVVRFLPTSLFRPLMARAAGKGRGDKMPSFHIDLRSLNSPESEVQFLHGAVAAYGARLGVPAPVNQFLATTLQALTERRIPLDAYTHQPEKLIQELQRYKMVV